MPVFEILREWVLPVTGALALIQLGWIVRDRVWRRASRGAEPNAHTAWLCALGSLVGGVAVLAVLEHRLAYRLFRLLMPVSRTGLFFLPLVTLMVGIAAAIPAFSRGAAVCRGALIGALCVVSFYYLFCMRLMYFEEWDYQADLNPAYKVVACYNHERNVQDVEVSWEYHAGMNFLRLASGRETFGPFSSTTPAYHGPPDVCPRRKLGEGLYRRAGPQGGIQGSQDRHGGGGAAGVGGWSGRGLLCVAGVPVAGRVFDLPISSC